MVVSETCCPSPADVQAPDYFMHSCIVSLFRAESKGGSKSALGRNSARFQKSTASSTKPPTASSTRQPSASTTKPLRGRLDY